MDAHDGGVNVWVLVAISFWAFVLGTFIEWWAHRRMHARGNYHRRHVDHHVEGTGQGVVGEFRDYVVGSLPVLVPLGIALWLWPDARPYLLAFLGGDIVQMAFAAYAHQLQHQRPELVFWMQQPVHHVHHAHKQWKHNFGISLDVWDRIFGTFEPVSDAPRAAAGTPLSAWLSIKWL